MIEIPESKERRELFLEDVLKKIKVEKPNILLTELPIQVLDLVELLLCQGRSMKNKLLNSYKVIPQITIRRVISSVVLDHYFDLVLGYAKEDWIVFKDFLLKIENSNFKILSNDERGAITRFCNRNVLEHVVCTCLKNIIAAGKDFFYQVVLVCYSAYREFTGQEPILNREQDVKGLEIRWADPILVVVKTVPKNLCPIGGLKYTYLDESMIHVYSVQDYDNPLVIKYRSLTNDEKKEFKKRAVCCFEYKNVKVNNLKFTCGKDYTASSRSLYKFLLNKLSELSFISCDYIDGYVKRLRDWHVQLLKCQSQDLTFVLNAIKSKQISCSLYTPTLDNQDVICFTDEEGEGERDVKFVSERVKQRLNYDVSTFSYSQNRKRSVPKYRKSVDDNRKKKKRGRDKKAKKRKRNGKNDRAELERAKKKRKRE